MGHWLWVSSPCCCLGDGQKEVHWRCFLSGLEQRQTPGIVSPAEIRIRQAAVLTLSPHWDQVTWHKRGFQAFFGLLLPPAVDARPPLTSFSPCFFPVFCKVVFFCCCCSFFGWVFFFWWGGGERMGKMDTAPWNSIPSSHSWAS